MSPSLRGRGLKSFSHICSLLSGKKSPSLRGRGLKYKVAQSEAGLRGSPSLRGRGLKYVNIIKRRIRAFVALFTRAWIEICASRLSIFMLPVALFTRAWIEIVSIAGFVCKEKLSPSLRGRGLKYKPRLSRSSWLVSPSLRGRGLKYQLTFPKK